MNDAIIERNRGTMRRFETCINTNDLSLGEKLISSSAAFTTPVSPEPLHGAKGYLSVVEFMRRSFPDVHWKLVNMVADETTVAVQVYRNLFRRRPVCRTSAERQKILDHGHELLHA